MSRRIGTFKYLCLTVILSFCFTLTPNGINTVFASNVFHSTSTPQENYRNLQSQHINEVAGPDMIYFSPNRSTRIDHTNRINSFVVNTEDTIPYPYLSIRANWDTLDIEDYPIGSELSLEIYDTQGQGELLYSAILTDIEITPWNPSGTQVSLDLSGIFNIQPYQFIKVTDGVTEKTLEVPPLEITEIDLVNDKVYGIATPHENINVWVSDNENTNRHVVADENGEWEADYKNKGTREDEQAIFDLKRGHFVDSTEADEDADRTFFGRYTIPPSISVRANWDTLSLDDFAVGAELSLEIDDPGTTINPDYSTIVNGIEITPWDPSGTSVSLDLAGIFDIQPGQVITVENGLKAKTLLVSPLEITEIDLKNDKVYGIATHDENIHLWVSDHENTNISLDVHGNGEWDFDYCDNETGGNEQCLINLLPGYFLDSTEMDEDGDRTFFGRYPLTPNLLVRANWDTLDIYEYAAGVELSLNIYDHQPLEEPIYSATLSGTVTTPWDENRTWLSLDLSGVFDIQPGQIITVDDGIRAKSLVVTPLEITEIDLQNDIVYGIASPDDTIHLWVSDHENTTRAVDAIDGKWVVDYRQTGTGEDEQFTFDLLPGHFVDSSDMDEDGDRTFFGVEIPMDIERDALEAFYFKYQWNVLDRSYKLARNRLTLRLVRGYL